MNTGLMVMENNLQAWSWQDIINIYRILGRQLKEYERIKKSIRIGMVARGFNSLALDAYFFNEAFTRDVRRLDAQVAALDREIARRNQLVGNFR